MGPVERSLVRDVAAIAAASGVIGASFGAIAVASGLSVGLASAMSLLVFAGWARPVGVLAGALLAWRKLPFVVVVVSAAVVTALLRMSGID